MMKKRLFASLCAAVFCLFALLPVIAADMPRVVDGAELLSPIEESRLREKLDEISTRQGLDVVVVTVEDTGGKSAMAYADDFYDYNGYAPDGILLLIGMEEREWWISTSGYGITAFTDDGIDYISERILSDLSDGCYTDAFDTYAELCDAFIDQARSGEPFDYGNLPKEPFDFGASLLLALIVGVVVAFIVTASMKAKLKSVRPAKEADRYVKQGSMNITSSRDLYLYRTVRRIPIPKETSGGGGSSTHRSSSGRSHGGGGGRF